MTRYEFRESPADASGGLTGLVELGQPKVDGLEGRVVRLRLEQKVLQSEAPLVWSERTCSKTTLRELQASNSIEEAGRKTRERKTSKK